LYDPVDYVLIETLAVSPIGATVRINMLPVEGTVGISGSELVYTAPPGLRDRFTVRQFGSYYLISDSAAVLQDVDGPGGVLGAGHASGPSVPPPA
jgi:hypothetical protein